LKQVIDLRAGPLAFYLIVSPDKVKKLKHPSRPSRLRGSNGFKPGNKAIGKMRETPKNMGVPMNHP